MERIKKFGCIADDFTGASDAASFLQKAGMKTVLLNGVPLQQMDLAEFDAVVVALKTRTEPVDQAVEHSMQAVRWMEQQGVQQYYFKYCSTFDSTREGNIGPILDAALEYFDQPYTILCPALPVNGRCVVDGRLMVNGVPLDQSPMKDHPLTPMWDSRIKNLMEAQSRYRCYELNRQDLEQSNLSARVEDIGRESSRFYLIPDYETDADGEAIAQTFGQCKILSGGSGLLEHLHRQPRQGVLLAGSCSKATLEQIARYQQAGHPSYQIDPKALWEGRIGVQTILDYVLQYPQEYVLVYSSADPAQVKETQKLGKAEIAQMLEDTLSETARRLVAQGYRHVIVAGGETSGAVTRKLGYNAFQIGKSVAPGVPLMIPVEDPQIRLVLKSGNFGQPDFFERAIAVAKGE